MTDQTPAQKPTPFHDLPAAERVKQRGYRRYVGGRDSEKWYHLGRMQYHFLVSHGLKPQHRLLDVACGALRLGQWVIPMLDEGNYFGIEGEPSLVEQGRDNEMLYDVMTLKKPRFAFNYDFDLRFCDGYDYAIAQSLFTHLTLDDIAKCFENMRKIANAESKFFWTYFDGNGEDNPAGPSHPNRSWTYRFDEIEALARDHGFKTDNIGDWQHPKDQRIACSVPS